MKIGKTSLSQKIVISIITIMLLFNIISPNFIIAADEETGAEKVGGVLFEPIQMLTVFLGDTAIWLMQNALLHDSDKITQEISADGMVKAPGWVKIATFVTGGAVEINDSGYTLADFEWSILTGGNSVDVPQIRISPESIFSNKIPAFDINFFQNDEDFNTDSGGRSEVVKLNTIGNFVKAAENGKINLDEKAKNGEYYKDIAINLYKKAATDSSISITQPLSTQECENTINNIKGNNQLIISTLNEIILIRDGAAQVQTGLADIVYTEPGYTSENNNSAKVLQSTVSFWYNLLRNVAIIGLLSVLVYIGIRIVTSSAATDKSKYKEMLKDWVVALFLLFFMHYIMSFIVTATTTVSESLIPSNDLYSVKTTQLNTGGVEQSIPYFGDRLIGNARLQLQSDNFLQRMSYTIIYLVLVIYTLIFAIMYLKRVIYMAFFTMIAPLVALTYPIDKVRDGKAQAFEFWLKEYTFNALIQPFHLILYYLIVGSALELAQSNPIYALVAIGFMLPAEKILRKFFGFDKASTAGGLGGLLSGALAMQGINALKKRVGGGSSGGKGKSSGFSEKEANKPIRTADSGRNIGSLISGMSEGRKDDNNEQNINSNINTTKNSNNADNKTNKNNRNFASEDPYNPGYDMSGNPIGYGNIYDEKGNEKYKNQDRMDELEEQLSQYSNEEIYMNPELQALQEEYDELDAERRMLENENMIDAENQNIPESIQTFDNNTSDIPNAQDVQDETPEQQNDVNVNEEPDETIPLDEDRPLNVDPEKIRRAKREVVKGYAKDGLKYTGSKLGRGLLKTIGAGTLGTIGVAAGLASDSYADVVKYGVAGGVAGNMIGGKVANKVGSIPGTIKGVKNNHDAIRTKAENKVLTKDERKILANKRADDAFLKDKEAINRYKNEYGKELYEQRMKDALKYREYGITDDEDIIKAMNLNTEGLSEDKTDKMRILVAKTHGHISSWKDIDAYGDTLKNRKFSDRQINAYKKALRKFNGWD